MEFFYIGLSVLFGFMLFADIRRRGYHPIFGIGVMVLCIFKPVLLFPISIGLMFLPNKNGPSRVQFFRQGGPSSAKTTSLPQISMCPKCGHENPVNTTSCLECHNQLSLNT